MSSEQRVLYKDHHMGVTLHQLFDFVEDHNFDIVSVLFYTSAPSQSSINILHELIYKKCKEKKPFQLYFDIRNLNPMECTSLITKQREFRKKMTTEFPGSVERIGIVLIPLLKNMVDLIFLDSKDGTAKTEFFTETKKAWDFVHQ
jgi:hypothetical protein